MFLRFSLIAQLIIINLLLMNSLWAAERINSPLPAHHGSKDSAQLSEPPLEPIVIIQDPLQRFNRGMFTFNDKFDAYLLRPIATLYNKIMPKPLNCGIHNFFNNIGTVTTIWNDILQLRFTQTLSDLWRFGINSTLGIGGLFDVATGMQLPSYSNDFGLTLANLGWCQSSYLVLPFFGPNTMRDGIALPVDYFAFSPYESLEPSTRYGLYALAVVDRRAQLLKFQPVFEEAALDKYLFLRSAYIQKRNQQILQNKALGFTGRIPPSTV